MSGFLPSKNTKQFLRCLLALCNIFLFHLLFFKWHHARGGSFVSSAYLLLGVSLKRTTSNRPVIHRFSRVSSFSCCDKPKATVMMSSESHLCCLHLFVFPDNSLGMFSDWKIHFKTDKVEKKDMQTYPFFQSREYSSVTKKANKTKFVFIPKTSK